MSAVTTSTRTDVYTRVTNHIVAQLEQGIRLWHKPWAAEHAAGRINRPSVVQQLDAATTLDGSIEDARNEL